MTTELKTVFKLARACFVTKVNEVGMDMKGLVNCICRLPTGNVPWKDVLGKKAVLTFT